MNFLSILKKIGSVAGKTAIVVAPSIGALMGSPALGALITTVITSVVAAESKGGTNEEKKENAIQSLVVASPAIILMIEAATGKELVDETKFGESLGKLVDAAVDLLKSFGELPKPTPPQP